MADDEKINSLNKTYIPPHKRQSHHSNYSAYNRSSRNYKHSPCRKYQSKPYNYNNQQSHYQLSSKYDDRDDTKANVIQFEDDETNVIQFEDDKMNVIQSVDDKANVIQSQNDKVNVIQSENDKANVIQTHNDKVNVIQSEDDKANVIQTQNDKVNVIQSEDDKANVIPSQNDKVNVIQSENDKAFDEYLNKYKEEHKKKYIAPFQIRRIKKEYESAMKEQRKLQKQKEKENKNDDENVNNANAGNDDRFPMEYLFFRDFYLKYSAYYSEWQYMRQDGWNNQYLETFFNLKHKNQDNVSRSSDRNIVSLFRRFYRYAIDIDSVCGYKLDLISKIVNNNVYFLDIGFAPGGMSRLLLDGSDTIYGVGITLPPYECGNAFIPELLHNARFLCREHDVVHLGRKISTRRDFLTQCIENDYSHDFRGFDLNDFRGFDLIIVGITCHQDFESNERLDHQILLSELYLAFLTLNHGGSILIRHKIALDCIHQHILYIFLKCFAQYKVGKPMTEFAIRKTFWILWKGFDKNVCKELKLISFLRKLIHEYDGHQPPYGKNPKTQQYHNPKMIDRTPQQIVDELQPEAIINVMDPVFEIQLKSLRSFCSGKKDRLCNKGKNCKRNDCNRAHSENECIDGFYQALQNVDNVLNQQIAFNKHQSKVLTSLDKQNKRKQKKNTMQSNTRNTQKNKNKNNNWRR